MSQPTSLHWFAAHEFRLAWRDWVGMLTAHRKGRAWAVTLGLSIFFVFMHGIAFVSVGEFARSGGEPTKTALAIVSSIVLLAWCLMISQAMEAVTRAFYSRADLDLILSSPAAARRLFSVRIFTLALSAMGMAMLLAGPFVNVLALMGGPRWLLGYGVFIALGAAAAAVAVAVTVALFRLIGPRRTRFVAQVVAALIGAFFVIGLQVAAVLSYGTLSRTALLTSGLLVRQAPELESPLYWPARALLGDPIAFMIVFGIGALALMTVIQVFAARFGEHAIAASGATAAARSRGSDRVFRSGPVTHVLRRKEWTLLRRDPWLISQTLVQILYLLPPALYLWRSFGEGHGLFVVLVPLLVMAAGQLAGGLAWLAISGEDAPDLVASAPVPPGWIVRAKIEAVLSAVAIVFAPFVLAFALISYEEALAIAWFAAVAATSATAIQFWFRTQAKRSQFRRRHTSSRIATFAEAFSSIAWAGTAALAAVGMWQAIIAGVLALGVLGVARLISPHRAARSA